MPYCVKCNFGTNQKNPFDEYEALCPTCLYEISVSHTEAKTVYKVDEEVLKKLLVYENGTSVGWLKRRYLLEDIKNEAIKKYGVSEPEEISKIVEKSYLPNEPLPEEFTTIWYNHHTGNRGILGAYKRYLSLIKEDKTIVKREDLKERIAEFIAFGGDTKTSIIKDSTTI